MHSRILTALLLEVMALCSRAQYASPLTWGLQASIAGEELTGAWGLSQVSSAVNRREVLAGAEVSQVGVVLGTYFPIQVKLVDPVGTVMGVTGSAKILCRPKACLTVTVGGTATVAESPTSLWACEKGALSR